jgi:hypothetical protein
MSVPPAFALSAFYEGVLQAALRQFFRRASLEIEPGATVGPDRTLAIDSITDPSVMRITWAANAYTLRMPGRSTFTPHQIRMARAIVAVIGSRYRAILHPELAAERGEMFRGPIEDRYVGAFFDERPYTTAGAGGIDRIAAVIEMLRVAALSSYENRPISTVWCCLVGISIRAVPSWRPGASIRPRTWRRWRRSKASIGWPTACAPSFSPTRTGASSTSSTSIGGAGSSVRTRFSTCRAPTPISRTPAPRSSRAVCASC